MMGTSHQHLLMKAVRQMHPSRIQADIDALCSPRSAGRLSGTEGALHAASFLAGALYRLGLQPIGPDWYYQHLSVPAARLTGPAVLKAGTHNFRHRKDFGEAAAVSAGGVVTSTLLVVRDGQDLDPSALAGKVALIPNRPAGFDLGATVRAATDLGVAGLLVESGEPHWFHKAVYGSETNQIPVLRLRRSVAAALAHSDGAHVHLELPLEAGRRPCRNVLGLLPGRQAPYGPTLALTAHYDHVGDDPGGERFPGAGDNASGVAAILAVLRALVETSTRLPFNVMAAFLTGEESGLWGARHLAEHSPVPLAAVINVDGVGLEPTLAAIRLGYPAPGNWLADLSAPLWEQNQTTVQWITGSDDSSAFQRAGLPALGLGQQPTNGSLFAFHTPDDLPSRIHLPALAQTSGGILALVHRLAAEPSLMSPTTHAGGLQHV